MRSDFKLTILFGILILSSTILTRCVPPEKKIDRNVSFSLDEPEVQAILDFQDRRAADSLLPYLTHKRSAYRMLAARAYGSIQDSSFVDTLLSLLYDPVAEVREFAAFALGQTRAHHVQDHLVAAFDREDTTGYYFHSNAAILEAVGKCGGPNLLNALSTISSYRPEDTALVLGQVRGIYQFALRGITLPEATNKMVAFLIDDNWPPQVRLMASHYLARARNIDLKDHVPDLIHTLRKESDPNLRMTIALALGKSKVAAAKDALTELYPGEEDYRVKCNMLRAMGSFPYDQSKTLWLSALRDPEVKVAQVAAEQLLNLGKEADAITYRQLARDTFNRNVSALLYQATNKHVPYYYSITKNNLRYEISRKIRETSDPYFHAALLKALAEDPRNYNTLIETALDETLHPVIRTIATESLKYILDHPEFNSIFQGARRNVKRQLYEFFQKAALSGDAGLTAIAGTVFQVEELEWSPENWDFLLNGVDSLTLPNDLESCRELQKAYVVRTGDQIDLYQSEKSKPIAWALLKRVSKDTRAVIRTNKGPVTIEFYPKVAPGSVANFISLAQAGFFDDKVFHRVVPNFVVQGGCPRGDGYGSLDYTIRSEFSTLNYDNEGWIGMASAGKDTEGTQFFITHSPTPHLDGRYSIFARVVDGMVNVHHMTQGDTIKNIIFNAFL